MKPRFSFFKASSVPLLVALLFTGCSKTPQQKEAGFLDAGRKHLKAGDVSRAVLDFRNAAAIMPRDPEPHYQRGLALLAAGNAQAGVSELLATADLDPKHLGSQLKLAEIFSVNNSLDVVNEGKKRAQLVLQLDPNNADALQMLATAEVRLGDSESAVQYLQRALQQVPQHLGAAMTLAMLRLQNHDPAGAEQVIQQAIAESPRSTEHAVAAARFYLLLRKPAEAEKQFRRALEIDRKSGPALVGLAPLLYREGKADEADRVLQRAAALPDKVYRPVHAMFLLQTGKTDAAIAELDKLYKNDRTDREARTRLVAALIQTGRTADAEKTLAAALKQNPKDSDALLQRGELYAGQGKYQEAETDLNGVLRFQADSPQAHFVLAKIHAARGATASERQDLSEALRLNPKFLAARIQLAHSLTLANQPRAALDVLDQASDQDRKTLAVVTERNAALYALGDDAGMRKGVDLGLATLRTPELLLQDGILRIKQHDYKGGRAALEEVLTQQPQEWRALESLAMSYVAEKKLPEATAIVRDHTSQQPNSAAKLFLGSWLLRTGDRAGARAAFQEAKSLAPNSPAPDFELAELDLREGKLDSARIMLLSLLGRQPGNLAFILDLGQAEYRAGRLSEAIGYYEQAVTADPTNVPALNNLAFLLADTGKDPDRALMLAQQVKELAPDDITVDDTIGWAYYQKGLFQTAVEYLNMSKTTTPRWKCHLAMADIKVGRRQQAAELVQAALKEDPSVPEAKRAMNLLASARD